MKTSSLQPLLREHVGPPSYQTTKWIWLNGLLDYADSITGRRAGLLQRFFCFLLVGGIGAIVNLLCFTVVYASLLHLTIALAAYFGAFFLATEISILANFVLNDRITFRHLYTSDLSWKIRCLRFHITSIGGTSLTLGCSFSLLHFFHVSVLFSQAIALVIAAIFNFIGHHIFTYRHVHKGVVEIR